MPENCSEYSREEVALHEEMKLLKQAVGKMCFKLFLEKTS